MTCQGEQALLGLVVPDLDCVVITSTDKQWLSLVKVHSSNRTYIIVIRYTIFSKSASTFVHVGLFQAGTTLVWACFTYSRGPQISQEVLLLCNRKG